MKALLRIGNKYVKKSSWRDFAVVKFCLFAMGLIAGTYVDGDLVVPAEVSIVTDEKERSVLSITINEGKNREIRKMVEGLGYEVKRLKRTSIGCVSLGHMKPGEIRELTRAERQGLSKLKHTRSRETE